MTYGNEFKISGTILCIDKTRPSREGSNMMIRDFFLQTSSAGITNDIKCQLVRNNCSLIDTFIPGDEVFIKFSVVGGYKGAQPKEGHPQCNTNPIGMTDFSPNINVYGIEFEDGFKRSQAALDRVRNWIDARDTTPVAGGVNPNPNPNFNQSPETIDDLPF